MDLCPKRRRKFRRFGTLKWTDALNRRCPTRQDGSFSASVVWLSQTALSPPSHSKPPAVQGGPSRNAASVTVPPMAPLHQFQPRPGRGRPRSPPSCPLQLSRPTLPPVLRICQGHVSTLPNSEFLIMPNMVTPWGLADRAYTQWQ